MTGDRQCRILYLDDETSLLELGKIYLEDVGGFEVETAEGAPEAIGLLEKADFDAVISDYQMPRMDGLEFLKRLRSHENDLPFIIFTGKGREEVAVEAFMSGADFYLQKGGNPQAQFAELINMVRQAVSRRKSEKGLVESERRLKTMVDGMDQGLVVLGSDGRVRFYNRTAEEMIGVKKGQTLDDLGLFDCGPPGGNWPLGPGRPGGPSLRDDGLGLQRLRTRKRDGGWTWLEGFHNIIEFDGEEAVLILLRDITCWVEKEACGSVYEARYQSVVGLQRDMVCRFDPDMTMTFANPSFYETLLTSEEETVGRRVLDLMPEEEGRRFEELKSAICPQSPDGRFRHRLFMDDGSLMELEWSYQGIFDAEGRLIEYQAVGRTVDGGA